MRSNHLYYDVVLDGHTLVTALKDEGATNTFMSEGLAKTVGLDKYAKDLIAGETDNFRGMSGSAVACSGKLVDVPIQLGTLKTKLPTCYLTPEEGFFFSLG